MRLALLVRSLATLALVASFVAVPVSADGLWTTATGEQLIVIERGGGQAIGMWLEAGGARGHVLGGSMAQGRLSMVAEHGRLMITATYRPNEMRGAITQIGAPLAGGSTFAARPTVQGPSLASNGLWEDQDGVYRLVFVGGAVPAVRAMVVELTDFNGHLVVTDVMVGTATLQSATDGQMQVVSLDNTAAMSLRWSGTMARGQIGSAQGVRELRAERIE